MVAQTSVNTTNGPPSPPQSVVHNTSELLVDAMTLAELQSQLVLIDLNEDLRKLLWPTVALAAGAVLALSCLPIALVSVALGIMAATGLAPWLAFLIALGIGLALAAGLILGATWRLMHGLTFLVRSRNEWQQNMRWFKSLVRRLGASSSRPAQPGHRH